MLGVTSIIQYVSNNFPAIFIVLVLIAGLLFARQTVDFALLSEGVSRGTDRTSAKEQQSWYLTLFSWKRLALLLILIGGGILRFKGLTYQSLWLDELHAMIEANPVTAWPDFLFYFKCCDFNPPLFYIIERILFHLYGYTDLVARSLSAVVGVLSIGAIYWLGKELKDRSVGLIAAALTAVNYFAIYYSQEARPYNLLFLFTTLSYCFFIRVCKYQKISDTFWYVLFSICLIYTQYFGLLVLFCEGVIALILLLQEPERRKRLFMLLFISIIIIFIAYLPWLPYFEAVRNMHSYWVAPLKPYFFATFFSNYFGYSLRIVLIMAELLVFFATQALLRRKYFKKILSNTTVFGFVFFAVTVFFSLGIPYLRSVLVVPFLVPRYSIIVLPSILTGIALGIDFVKLKLLRWGIIAYLLWFSVDFLVNKMNYYSSTCKTQFREMTAYISEGGKNYPIVNEVTAWQQRYYLDLDHNTGRMYTGKKEDIIDSILHRNTYEYTIDTFWLVGAHFDVHLTAAKSKDLDTAYVLIKDRAFFDAWAELYGRKRH